MIAHSLARTPGKGETVCRMCPNHRALSGLREMVCALSQTQGCPLEPLQGSRTPPLSKSSALAGRFPPALRDRQNATGCPNEVEYGRPLRYQDVRTTWLSHPSFVG